MLAFGNFTICFSQTGISVTPPRIYFELSNGQTRTEKVTVTNVSVKNTLDLSVTLGDWEYNEFGDNLMYMADTLKNSCAGWVNINNFSYISLKPGESKTIDVSLTVPSDLDETEPVHTAMLYVTQMNPIDDIDKEGTNIKVNIRSGIKIFHRTPHPRIKKIEVKNLAYDKETESLQLQFNNEGNVWTDGNIMTDLLNKKTGKVTSLPNIIFYTMPGNKRLTSIRLPKDLETGSYSATVLLDYADEDNIEAAELQFTYE